LLFASLSEDTLGEGRGTDDVAEDFEGSSVGFCVSFELDGEMVGFSEVWIDFGVDFVILALEYLH